MLPTAPPTISATAPITPLVSALDANTVPFVKHIALLAPDSALAITTLDPANVENTSDHFPAAFKPGRLGSGEHLQVGHDVQAFIATRPIASAKDAAAVAAMVVDPVKASAAPCAQDLLHPSAATATNARANAADCTSACTAVQRPTALVAPHAAACASASAADCALLQLELQAW